MPASDSDSLTPRPRTLHASIKRIIVPAAAACFALVLLALGMELVATAFVVAREGRYVQARERFANRNNTFVAALARGECGYLDSLYPHPYLGFVHHGNPPCGMKDINNIGLFGPDFPSQRPNDRFVILVTGGSVAAQFAQPLAKSPTYLEQFLNSKYVSPTGMPFLVLDGGDGAWKHPQSTILSLLYADAVHAIVTLDGFNEHFMLETSRRFEVPANNFLSVNPLATQNFGAISTRWAVGRLRAKAGDNALLSRSHATYEIVAMLERWAERRATATAVPKTSVDTLFALPSSWTAEQRRTWQINQYKKYLRAITAIARDQGALSAHFIQPVPAFGKPLTPDERRAVGDLDYRDSYLGMVKEMLTLNDSGTSVVSMLSLFDGDTRTLYGDPIHMIYDPKTKESPGYERMAAQMADDLGRLWHLRQR
jgi:hypothetical protein